MDRLKSYRRRLSALESERSTWDPHWQDISEHLLPRRSRFLSKGDQDNRGDKRNQKIVNSVGTRALNMLAAGMHGGLTSPARPWFRLGLADRGMMEWGPAKLWLHEVERQMMDAMSKAGFYNAIHTAYAELAGFGTCALHVEFDYYTTIRFRPFTIGEFFAAVGPEGRVDTVYRVFQMTASQMVRRFGEEAVSGPVKRAAGQDQTEQRFEVVHVVQPRAVRDPSKRDNRNMPFESVYFEKAGEGDKLLSESGYGYMPTLVSRWDVAGGDVYGRGPGMDALPDVKMLQKMERDKLTALSLVIRPPMNASPAMKSSGATLIPGGVNFIDATQGPGFVPAYQINPNFQAIQATIDKSEQSIREAFYNDLFLMLAQRTAGMTATEVVQRQEEKLIMLGPVLERQQAEILDPAIDAVFRIMLDAGLLPPPPDDLEGQEIKVEYISLLAQAQRMAGTGAIERTAQMVGSLAAVSPEVVDKFDADQAVDEYAQMVGISPKVIRPDEAVAEIRAQRAQQQQAAQMAAMAQQAAASARDLSSADMGGDNALTRLAEGMRAQ